MKRMQALKIGTLEDFFESGRRMARLADQGKSIPATRSISFESMEELLGYLTPKRIALFEALKVMAEPISITGVANQVGRDRAAVKRDIDALQQLGMVDVAEATLPGHGRQKLVSPAARKILLTAAL